MADIGGGELVCGWGVGWGSTMFFVAGLCVIVVEALTARVTMCRKHVVSLFEPTPISIRVDRATRHDSCVGGV